VPILAIHESVEVRLAFLTPVFIRYILIDEEAHTIAMLPHQALLALNKETGIDFDVVLLLKECGHASVYGGQFIISTNTSSDFLSIVDFGALIIRCFGTVFI